MEPAQAPKSTRIELVGNPPLESPPVTHSLAVVSRGGLVIPSADQVTALVEKAKSIDEMRDLHAAIMAMEAIGARIKVAFEVLFQLATDRLALERKAGIELTQTVRRGGHGSKLHNVTSMRGGCSARLPEGISRRMASWYRQLSEVPVECFDRYLARQRERNKTPTANGLLQLWRTENPAQQVKPKKQ